MSPRTVEQPGEVGAEQKAAFEAIDEKLTTEQATLNRIDAESAENQQLQKAPAEKIALAGKIDNFQSEYARLGRATRADLERLGLELKALVSLTVDKSTLTPTRAKVVADKAAADAALDEAVSNSLPAQKTSCLARTAALQGQLDAEQASSGIQ